MEKFKEEFNPVSNITNKSTKDLFNEYLISVRNQANKLKECDEIEAGESYLRFALKDWKEILDMELHLFGLKNL